MIPTVGVIDGLIDEVISEGKLWLMMSQMDQ